MGQAKRRRPDPMPANVRVTAASENLDVPMIVAGARGTKRSLNPNTKQHSQYLVRGGDLAAVEDKHVILFVHGYNVNARQSLDTAADLFSKTQAAIERDGHDPTDLAYVAFTWPGDVGPLWFSDAQDFAQHSGVALYRLARDLHEKHHAKRLTLITHSLGAHVGLRSAAILGQRLFSGKTQARYSSVLLLAPAVEDDVFERPRLFDEYHFPEAPFGMSYLHMFTSRADDVLKNAFFASELDKALGYTGPPTMKPLKAIAGRMREILGDDQDFRFQLHDLSPRSTTIYNPDLHAHYHSDYWSRPAQVDYYVNFLH